MRRSESAHVDTYQVCRPFVVVHRDHRDPEARCKQQPDQRDDDNGRRGDGRQTDEGRNRIAGGATHHLEIENARLHDLAKREGGKGEINAAGAQHRHSHDERHRSGNDPGERNGDEGRQLEHIAQISRSIGADRGEAGQPQIELSCRQRQEAAIGEHDVHREQNQNTFEISAHARCPANAPPNKPAGRTNRISSSSP